MTHAQLRGHQWYDKPDGLRALASACLLAPSLAFPSVLKRSEQRETLYLLMRMEVGEEVWKLRNDLGPGGDVRRGR